MLIPTPEDLGIITNQLICLNAPQGFMLIPTVLKHGYASGWVITLVLMPLRASCSFQQRLRLPNQSPLQVLMPLRASCSFQQFEMATWH